MRYVEIKSQAQLEVQSPRRLCGRLVAETALINQLRALLRKSTMVMGGGTPHLINLRFATDA
jgi:hypothetical protein